MKMPTLSTCDQVMSTKTRYIDVSGFGMPDPRKNAMPRELKYSIDNGAKRSAPPMAEIAARVQSSAVPRVAPNRPAANRIGTKFLHSLAKAGFQSTTRFTTTPP